MELLLEASLEDGVRALWRRLHDAGLPSLATHDHPTNRPHLTLLTATSITGLPPLPLPVAVELGPAQFFGRALVRVITPTAELCAVHARVWSAPADAAVWPAPADWTPHVSLALRVPPDRREAARRLLATIPPTRGWCTAARSYDTDTRTATPL